MEGNDVHASGYERLSLQSHHQMYRYLNCHILPLATLHKSEGIPESSVKDTKNECFLQHKVLLCFALWLHYSLPVLKIEVTKPATTAAVKVN
jgi:hypothetical protein